MASLRTEAEKIVTDRAREAHEQAVSKVERELTREAVKEDARQATADRTVRQRAAEEELRAQGPVVTVEFKGLRVRFFPEHSADHVARQYARTAFGECLGTIGTYFNRELGQARAEAVGLSTPDEVPPFERLVERLRDSLRAAIARGACEIEYDA